MCHLLYNTLDPICMIVLFADAMVVEVVVCDVPWFNMDDMIDIIIMFLITFCCC